MIKELQKKLLGKNNYNELLIKKLEKENKKLKSKIFWLEQEKVDFRESIEAYLSMLDERDNRIDKAIEYIEQQHLYEIYFNHKEETHKLLDILKGKENE